MPPRKAACIGLMLRNDDNPNSQTYSNPKFIQQAKCKPATGGAVVFREMVRCGT